MTNHYLKSGKATALLAVAALLLVVGQSNAQQNSLTFPWQSQGGRQSAFIQPAPLPANVENSRAFYPNSANADKVFVDVRVPAGAKIMFEGMNTTSTGEVRQFVSPSLATGFNYTYHVRATWMENGREVNQTRSFAVRPGDVVHMIFTRDDVKIRTEN